MAIFVTSTVSFCCAYSTLLERYLSQLNERAFCQREELADSIGTVPTTFRDVPVANGILGKIEELVAKVIRLSGDYSFGLELAKSLHPSDYGALGVTLMNCPRVIDALSFATTYKHFVLDGFYAHIKQDGKFMSYEIDNDYKHKFMEPIVELDFASVIQFGRFLAGPHENHALEIEHVHFMHSPHRAAHEYEAFFGCPVYFNQPKNKMVALREAIEVPVIGANPELFELLNKQFHLIEKSNRESLSLKERVRSHISSCIGSSAIELESVAEHFNMSISTFKKRLQDENVSFQMLYNEVKMKEACRLIRYSKLSLKQVGFDLGFGSASAFNKAFRRWLGMSPAEYRRENTDYRQAAN